MAVRNKKEIGEIKIALVCPGIGNQQRGLESFFQSLFGKLKGKINIRLIKGNGQNRPDEIVIPHIKRDSWILGGKNSPWGWGRRYEVEQLSFFFSFLPHLIAADYDIIQSSDPYLSIYIHNIQKFLGKRYKTIFTNAFPMTPEIYLERFNLVQQVSKYYYDQGLSVGIPEERMILIPYAIDTDLFKPTDNAEKVSLRARYKIPKDKIVILSAGSIDFSTKRMDYLIKEVAIANLDTYLLLVGQENHESQKIKELGQSLLGEKIGFLSVKHDEMPSIYNLSDIFALGSLKEGFGLAYVEAMASGLPVISHNHPSMGWVLGDCAKLVDMTIEGNLAKTLTETLKGKGDMENLKISGRERVINNFSWDKIIQEYLKMYNDLAG